jgi:dolichyl-phosphate beta-glucosyltransferase
MNEAEISLIIPACNEERRLEPTVREAAAYFRARSTSAEIVVVDDGSRDRTAQLTLELARELPELRLIRLPENRGKGYAVRSGVLNAAGRRVLFADADGSTPISDIERLEAALDNGASVAIGSRALRSPSVKVRARSYRRLIGRAFHALVSLLTVRGIRDTQCGFKLFPLDVAIELFSRIRMDGFSFDVELLMLAQQRGYRVAEIPVNWSHKPGSRVNMIADPLRMAVDLFVIRLRSGRGRYSTPHVALVPARSATTWGVTDRQTPSAQSF